MKFQSNSIFNGTITANSVADAGTNTDKFLVLNSSGVVTYRTAAELYADLGVGSSSAAYTSTLKHQVKAGEAINKGQAVYVSSANGTNMIVTKASNTAESTSSKTMGLLETTLALNGIGNVITEGLLSGLDTTGATNAGDPVWLGTSGNLIYGLINKPYAPTNLVFIGIVTRVNVSNGEIFVKVQNGFEIEELHDVDLKTTTPINGHILGYNGTLWVNKTIAGWLGFTPVTNARTLTINGTAYDLSADRSWTVGTVTSVAALTIGTTGTDITSSVATGTTTPVITLNIPDASATARGLITTGTQTIAGAKDFSSVITVYESSGIRFTNNPITTTYGAIIGNSTFFQFSALNGASNILFSSKNGTAAILINSAGKVDFGSTIGNGTYTYTLPSATGTVALTSDLSSYVPYTEATASVNLGAFGITASSLLVSNNSTFNSNLLIKKVGLAVTTPTYVTQFAASSGVGIGYSDGTGGANFILQTASIYDYTFPAETGTIALTSNLSSYVPTSRTLTINGTAYDLSADRSWTIDSTTAATRTIQKFTATSGQTTFTITGGYTVGMVDVYMNGVKLDNATDFTASNGTTVVLAAGALINSIIEVYKFGSQFIPNNALRIVTSFTATAAQTTFTVNYSVGLVDVFYNGSCLAQSEYTATNGTSIILATACQVNDIVVVYAYSYSVGAYSGIGGSGTTNYHPKFNSSSSITTSGIYEGSAGFISIGNTNTTYNLDVSGTGRFTGTLIAANSLLVNATAQNGTDSKIYVKQSSDSSFRGVNIVSSTSAEYVGGMFMDGSGNFNIAQSYLGSGSYQSLTFLTSGTERMRITSGGNVIINGTTAAYSSTNRGNLTISGSASSLLGFHNGTSQTGYIYNDYSANLFQWYSVSNNIQVVAVSNGVQLSSGATSWSSVSDERLKNITGNIENAIESLMTLRTIKHTWKSDETNKENLGLIAQDVQKVFPQVIDINKLPSKLDDEYKDDTEYLAVRYTELIPVLVKAIQELSQELSDLKKLVATK